MKIKSPPHWPTFFAQALLISLSLFAIQSVKAQCCDYTLIMNDSYGDGWDGASMELLINDVSIGTYSAEGNQSTVTFEICNGDAIEIIYTAAIYEEEHSYQLIDPVWNVVFSDGPSPEEGSVFSGIGDCDALPMPGHFPCNAIPLLIDECIEGDNTNFGTSGYNPGCANFVGGDIWFALQVPPSGNLTLATSNGGLSDTGIAAWAGDDCANLNSIGCDDDAGPDYYSLLFLFDLTPGDTIYIEVFGYGGGQGFFDLCAYDLGAVVFENSELPIVVINTLEQEIENDFKIDALMEIKYNGVGNLTYVNDVANVYNGNIGIEIRGATSAGYPQPSYGFETRTALGENNNVSLLGMPEENDWVLLSNFNDLSLIRNTLSFKLFGEMGHYSVRTSLCEVLIDSSYKGIYVFGEKIKPDNNRVNIAKLTATENAGDSLTGGYILQQNYWDGNNSFESNYSPIDHPDFDVHFVYEYPKPDVITPQQKTYIASYVDTLETALYSNAFMDSASGYRNYMSVPSFIDYFIVNEFARSNDGFKKSVFFHKDKNSNGGKLKAGPVWDFDWAYKNLATCDIFDNTDGSGWAHLINDCFTDNYSTGWYVRLLQDSTFANQLRCTYEEYRTTILDTVSLFAYIDSVHDLVQNAQARHFQRWPILGTNVASPELEPIATTYSAEIEKLKQWIALRLTWLDENISGLCVPVVDGVEQNRENQSIAYYPNPSNGHFRFEGSLPSSSPMQMMVYDVTGKLIDSKSLNAGRQQFDYEIHKAGVYYFTIHNAHAYLQQGKLVVVGD